MGNQTNQISWYELIRRERELRSWTQEEVAGKIGVEPRTVRAWESGATFPSAKHRRKLAALYKKQLDELQLVKDTDKNETVRQQPVGLAHSEEVTGVQVSTHRFQLHWRLVFVLVPFLVLLILSLTMGTLLLRGFFATKNNSGSQTSLPPITKSTPGNVPDSTVPPTKSCSGDSQGVILYVDSNYLGYCRVFNLGNYDLAQFGLTGRIHSLRDPNGAYHITLKDRLGRSGYFEQNLPQLPISWNNQVAFIIIDTYPPITCKPGTDGIIAYVFNNYQGGCLFITTSITDVGILDFDRAATSLRFVGSYRGTMQVVIYRQLNYQGMCDTYWQDQPNMGSCADQVASIAVLPLAVSVPSPSPTASSTPTSKPCPATNDGVTLYVDPTYKGICHTFLPGYYDLSQFGLDQNVSSIRDFHAAYHITLTDKTNRPGYFDADIPLLPPDWNDQAHFLRVEKHRPTTCNPTSNGIVAYIDRIYQAGCLSITANIPDLTPLNFDHAISSLRFVGSYVNTEQLVIYRLPNYQGMCAIYSQDQPDMGACSDQAVSVQVIPITPPTPHRTAKYGMAHPADPLKMPYTERMVATF
jgi:transcriptional regulator with XRE-family HTH domain